MNRISVSVDVTKIDKSLLVVGEKGTYVDLILIPTPNSKFGEDFLIKQNRPMDPSKPNQVIGNARIIKPTPGPIPF